MAYSVNIDALIVCGDRLAQVLRVPSPGGAGLRLKIEEILFGRGAVECVAQGLITRTEGRDLLLAHLQTFICDSAGVSEPIELWQDEDLVRSVEIAWFGAPC